MDKISNKSWFWWKQIKQFEKKIDCFTWIAISKQATKSLIMRSIWFRWPIIIIDCLVFLIVNKEIMIEILKNYVCLLLIKLNQLINLQYFLITYATNVSWRHTCTKRLSLYRIVQREIIKSMYIILMSGC